MAWEETVTVIKIKGSKKPNDWLRRVGEEAVQVILDRTKAGKDKNGNPFHPYSDAYKNSDDFILAGKSANNVNLKLMGEMLADLSVLSARDNTIIIGFPDDEQRAKANGHITAKQGTGKLPKRDFLGISDKELQKILEKTPEPEKLREAERKAAKQGITLEDIFGILTNEGEIL
jgi:hypothetical protein